MDKKKGAVEEEGIKGGRQIHDTQDEANSTQFRGRIDGVGSESEVQNPLQNPLILHHVLSYINDLKDLKNCRLVHSTWTAEASTFLKKKSIIKISKQFLRTSEEDMINLKVFWQLDAFQPQNLLLFPTLDRNRPDYSYTDWEIVKKQIYNLSHGVKSLKFPNTEVPRPVGTQSFTEILHSNFPNLVQLTLGDSNFSWPNPPPPPIPSLKRIDWTINCHCYPCENLRPAKLILLEGVIELAPNLESLKLIEQRYRSRPPFFANMFLDYFNSNPSCCPNLKDLNLDYLSLLDIDALLNLKMKLRSLKFFKLPIMDVHESQIFQDFLKGQSGTLETLEFAFPSHPTGQSFYFTFPCLPKLKKLKLFQDGSTIRMKLEDVDYANQFPVLQSLVIRSLGSSGRDRIWVTCPLYAAFLPLYAEDLDKQVCRTLRVLKLPYPNQPELKPRDHDLFGIRERLSIMFPNVHNEHLNVGRARVAEGHPYLPSEPIPVSRRTRSKGNSAAAVQN